MYRLCSCFIKNKKTTIIIVENVHMMMVNYSKDKNYENLNRRNSVPVVHMGVVSPLRLT